MRNLAASCLGRTHRWYYAWLRSHCEGGSRTGLGELTVLLPSWRLHLEASILSLRTNRTYTDDGAPQAAFLVRKCIPTTVANIRREHLEAFIAAGAISITVARYSQPSQVTI